MAGLDSTAASWFKLSAGLKPSCYWNQTLAQACWMLQSLAPPACQGGSSSVDSISFCTKFLPRLWAEGSEWLERLLATAFTWRRGGKFSCQGAPRIFVCFTKLQKIRGWGDPILNTASECSWTTPGFTPHHLWMGIQTRFSHMLSKHLNHWSSDRQSPVPPHWFLWKMVVVPSFV